MISKIKSLPKYMSLHMCLLSGFQATWISSRQWSLFLLYVGYLREAQDHSFLPPEPWMPLRGDSAATQPPICLISAFPTSARGLRWPSCSHGVHKTPLSLPSTLIQAAHCLLSSLKEIVEGRQEGVKGRDYWSGKNRQRSQGPLWMGREWVTLKHGGGRQARSVVGGFLFSS